MIGSPEWRGGDTGTCCWLPLHIHPERVRAPTEGAARNTARRAPDNPVASLPRHRAILARETIARNILTTPIVHLILRLTPEARTTPSLDTGLGRRYASSYHVSDSNSAYAKGWLRQHMQGPTSGTRIL